MLNKSKRHHRLNEVVGLHVQTKRYALFHYIKLYFIHIQFILRCPAFLPERLASFSSGIKMRLLTFFLRMLFPIFDKSLL